MKWLVAALFLGTAANAAPGDTRQFSMYCKDLESAAYYAEALSRDDADELNMILDAKMCAFFPFTATGTVKRVARLGDTGYVAEMIEFDNTLKTITVTPESF